MRMQLLQRQRDQPEEGHPISREAMRTRFDKACTLEKVSFQLRGLRPHKNREIG